MRDCVLALVEEGVSYEEIGQRLGIRPGLAYLVATGLSADGSDAPSAHAHERPGFRPATQQLVNREPTENPTAKDSVVAWIKRRVAADRQMQEAAAARDAEPGEIQEGDETPDIVDVLTREHNQVKALLEQLSAIPGKRKGGSPAQMSARKSIVDMVSVRLSKHEAAEEEVLWPAVRRALPDGDKRADTAREQEQEGAKVLERLAKLTGQDDEFDELVEKLTFAARTHVAYEERVFLDLRDRMAQDERERLARAFRDDQPEQDAQPPGDEVVRGAGTGQGTGRQRTRSRPAARKGKPAKATGTSYVTPEDVAAAENPAEAKGGEHTDDQGETQDKES